MLIDLHVQSSLSQTGTLEPEEILLRAKQMGLDGVVFTEDQPHTAWKEIKEIASHHEITALFGLKLATNKGYYLLYVPEAQMVEPGALFPTWHNTENPFTMKEVQAVARRVGGLLAAAHPYQQGSALPSGDRIFQVRGLGALEVQNGRCSTLSNDFALEAATLMRIPGIGGSGTCESLDQLGKTATLFLSEPQDEDELIKAIRPGNLWPIQITEQPVLRSPEHGDRDDRRGGRDDRRGGRDGGDRGGRDDRDDRRGGRDDRRGGRDDRRGGRDDRGGRGRDDRGGRGRDDRGGRDDRRGGGRDFRSSR
ncbi:MAG: PHP domain-containing protein [Myxococcales bacterium]|nr:PHP domain-containing protein [Myxococcales bacterium]MCB9643354.1 PHP domain-containing protein [Myxococcales bacterium]